MKNNIIIIVAVFAIIIIAGFGYMNGYDRGQYYMINSNGEHVSNIGYGDIEGGFVIDNKHFWVLSRHNRFDSESKFYKETNFIVDSKGKVIFKGNAEKLAVDIVHNLLSYNGQYIFIDSKGKIVYKAPVDKEIVYGTNSFGVVPFYYRDENTKEEDRRYGYVNMKDEVVVEPKFKKAWAFNEEGLAHVVTEDGKHGFINTEGEFELQPVYDFAYDFSDGLAQVTMGDKHEYIDTKGQVVLEKEGGDFQEGYACVISESGKEAYMDKSGNLITDYSFDNARPFINGYAIVEVDGLAGFLDKNGNYLIEPRLSKYVGSFSEDGLASLENEDGLYGFINLKGEWHIQPQYENVGEFSDGVAVVKEQGKH